MQMRTDKWKDVKPGYTTKLHHLKIKEFEMLRYSILKKSKPLLIGDQNFNKSFIERFARTNRLSTKPWRDPNKP